MGGTHTLIKAIARGSVNAGEGKPSFSFLKTEMTRAVLVWINTHEAKIGRGLRACAGLFLLTIRRTRIIVGRQSPRQRKVEK
jgi:hypothetical protein